MNKAMKSEVIAFSTEVRIDISCFSLSRKNSMFLGFSLKNAFVGDLIKVILVLAYSYLFLSRSKYHGVRA